MRALPENRAILRQVNADGGWFRKHGACLALVVAALMFGFILGQLVHL